MADDSVNEGPVKESIGILSQKDKACIDGRVDHNELNGDHRLIQRDEKAPQEVDDSFTKGSLDETIEVISLKDKACADENKVELDGDHETIGGNDRTPEVGMVFKSHEEVCNFYKRYAQRVGFGVTIRRSSFNKDGRCREVKIQCCKGGIGRAKPNYLLRLTAKTNCPAMIGAKLWGDGLLHLEIARLEHNHAVNPSMSKFFRCNKKLSSVAKKHAEYNDEVGTQPNMSIGRVSRLKLGEGDTEAIHQFFTRMQSKNSNFFYSVDLDDEGRLRNVFWSDAKSRAAYQYFGDVISFDTTYLTNKYDMPFAPFVGVNHHGQLVLLGCCLLSDETMETYVWLFETWLACMSRRPPNAIITDQCKVIQDSVAKVFPGARHRLCLCHIMKKIPKELEGLAECKAIKKAMKKAVYDSLRAEEFEENWVKMIREYGLGGNEWFKSLYQDRHFWAPVFVKDTFWAGLSVTQRGESMDAFFDGYIHSKTSIKQFISKYEKALQCKYEKEAQADFESFHKSRHLLSKFYMEKQLSELYTIDMFKKFQDELQATMYCHVSLINVDGPIFNVVIKESVFSKDGKKLEDKDYAVLYNADLFDVRCICCLFQCRGILCKHALSVLKWQQVYEIPSQYIINRWRKGFKRLHALARLSNDIIVDNANDHYDYLSMRCLQLVEVGMISDDKFQLALKLIGEMEKFLLSDSTYGDTQPKLVSETASETNINLVGDNLNSQLSNSEGRRNTHNPLQIMQIGQLPRKRKESGLETTVKQHKKKVTRRTSKVGKQTHVFSSTPSAPLFSTDIRKQISTNEKVNPFDLSLGSHSGNHQYHIGNQSGMQSSILHMLQFDQQTIENQSRMQWTYQNMLKIFLGSNEFEVITCRMLKTNFDSLCKDWVQEQPKDHKEAYVD